MRPVSDRFLAALATSHKMVATVDVYYAGNPVAEGLAVVDGSVTLDRNAEARGRCDVTLAEPDMIPTELTDPLTPYGYELRVRRGIEYPDGNQELVTLGYFQIQTSETADPDRLVRLAGIDRSQRVRDARLQTPVEVSAGTNVGTAIYAVLTLGEIDGVGPGTDFTINLVQTGYTTPLSVFDEQADRWRACMDLAESAGCEIFFDGDGVLTMQEEPDLTTAVPVWTVAEGDGGVLVGASLGLDRSPAYNRVIATSENAATGASYRGVATDTDPASPSYYYGGFGAKPRFYASPLIASDAQAEAAATSILRRSSGIARSVTFTAIVNPALEASDVILLQRSALGLDEAHIIDQVTIPLSPTGVMTCATRSRQEG